MSEEEKKAIEIIKEEITRPNETALEVYVTDIKMLLHIIEKQQKENELFKSALESIFNENFEENFIRKDKIREKIKELEDNMILFTNDKEKFNRYKYVRNILEILLAEK